MSLFYWWVRRERWGTEGCGLTFWSLDQCSFYSFPKDDVDGIPSPGPRRARFLVAPMCCPRMDNPSILSDIAVGADARTTCDWRLFPLHTLPHLQLDRVVD